MEPRRIQLEPSTSLQKEKKDKDVKPSYRFDLKLDLTGSSCNEYSYHDLVLQRAKEKKKNVENESIDNLLDDETDKILEIARKLEEKYNPKPCRKKRKKGAVSEDYIDRGMGYDETDPFIDNDEAYDELVPSTLTTEFGGFYINAGMLEFKNTSETESTGGDTKVRKKKRKQKEDKEVRKKRIISDDDQIAKRRGRKPVITAVSALPKLKKKPQPTVADMLQQQKAKLHHQQQEKLQQIQLTPIAVERNIVDISPEIKSEITQYLPLIGPGPNSTIWDAIESVVKASAEEAVSNGSAVTGSSDGEEVVKSGSETVASKLPDNLPPDLDDLVNKLIEAAHNSEEGKCKFFSTDINNLLLNVELKSQELTSTQRSTIYSHLASHLPCTKETLQKRAKKLRLDQEDHKLREPMLKLKNAIGAALPEAIIKYEKLLQSSSERKKVHEYVPVLTDEETDDEDEFSDSQKKIFEWDDTTRQYLCDVVRIKLKCFEVSKTRVQSAEEYLKSFFRSEIKPFWPKGWMYARTLLKESREAHCHITNRPKKAIIFPKKSVSPAVTTIKPTLLTLSNTVISHDSNVEPALPIQRCVPSNLLMPDAERKSETKPFDDIKQADLIKLLTYPIKNNVFENIVSPQISPNTEARINESLSPKSNVSSHVKVTHEQNIGTAQPQNKLPVISSGKTELTNYADGSLASDMLACIIRASLADFPYAGSTNTDNLTTKTKSVITSGATLLQNKDTRLASANLPSDSFISQIKSEDVKPVKIEIQKPSQEISSNVNTNNAVESSNAHLSIKPLDITSNLLIKNKVVQSDIKPPVNLKVNSIIESRQFADAFERAEHLSLNRRPIMCTDFTKTAFPNLKRHVTSSAITSLVFSSTTESPVTASRAIHDTSSRINQDLAAKLSTGSLAQVSSAPYKKRNKYSQGSKNADKWNPYMDSGLNTSLLEGMKGFPFPVTTLPTPPPAHCSAPIKTVTQVKDASYVLHSQQSPRTNTVLSNSLIRLDCKNNFSRTNESSKHSHPSLTHIRLPLIESPRRQPLVKSWKPSQPAKSHQFLGNSSLLNPNSTSPNACTSTTHQNPTIVYAHSHPSVPSEKSALSHTQVQIPVHACHSSVQVPQPTTVHLSHISQASFLVHQQTNPSTTNHQPPAHSHSSTTFVHSLPSTTSTPLAATFTFSQEQKVIPRSN